MNLTIDFWTPPKKYWNLVECKRKHLARFNVYFNFVHSLLNIIRRLKLASPLPGQWDRYQSCKYTFGATFGISQHFLIARHKSFGRATVAHHYIKHVLWHAIAASVAFYSRPGLIQWIRMNFHLWDYYLHGILILPILYICMPVLLITFIYNTTKAHYCQFQAVTVLLIPTFY